MSGQRSDLLKRADDLSRRRDDRCVVTSTWFLTPAEQYEIAHGGYEGLVFSGGCQGCERQIAFFLPYYVEPEDFNPAEYITAIHGKTKFASPGHRDYLGAIMNLGITRESVGDIFISGDEAWFFVLPTVADHVLLSLDKIGRSGVKLERTELNSVPAPERKIKAVSFTVKSPRLDSVAAGMFNISRTEAAELIAAGQASLNYTVCQKTDAPVTEGDTVSLRGCGKGQVAAIGGETRKGRTFVEAEIYK
jgi:RNA-binding protein YlmH